MYRDLLAEQRNVIVGIDLGTTNSLVSIATDCGTRIIASPEGERMLPSAAAVLAGGRIVVGYPALARRTDRPESVVSSIKRFMGMDSAEAGKHSGEVSYRFASVASRVAAVDLEGKNLTAPEVSALYLKELRRWAEADLGRTVERAVVTVPAYFNDAQRQATRDAARIAGIDAVRIVNEPTAAALAYGLQEGQQGMIAVYDFGGGTFDISILNLTDGVFEVLATGGDTRLGGDDIDLAVASALYSKWRAANGATDAPETLTAAPPSVRAAFSIVAEQGKKELSATTEVTLSVKLPVGFGGEAGGSTWTTRLSRAELEALAAPAVDRTVQICHAVLHASGLYPNQLNEVLLVGGSSRMPLVQRQVAETFGRVPRCDINPDEVVALGAAVQARILAGGLKQMLLLDVTPLSLGIETFGGACDVIIPRNTTIPCRATATFSTNVDGQKNILIHVLQGEREMAVDNRSLARFVLGGLPPMPAGDPKVEVTFSLDANGMLSVTAREQLTGEQAKVDITPSSGLTDTEVQKLVYESFVNAQSDFQRRVLLDRRNEAASVLRAVKTALEQTGTELDPAYRAEIEAVRDSLAAAVDSGDADAIKRELEKTNTVTEKLAELQMNIVLARTMKGRTLEEVASAGAPNP